MRATGRRNLSGGGPFHAAASGASAQDRRPQRRRPTLSSGLVVLLGGAGKFDCTICDISGSGARITVPKDAHIPKHVFLIDVRGRVVYVAMVIWRRSAEVGLVFATDMPLAKVNDPALLFLKRAWLERAVR